MKLTQDLYRASLALLTDFYQLTMAYAYWKNGLADRKSVFHLFFRSNPFKGGYAVACGLEFVIDYLRNFSFHQSDLDFLSTIKSKAGNRLFEPEFLDYLAELQFSCDLDAIPEGTVVFPHEPLLRISGPVIQCQLLETPLLNMINFQTLIATKSARINISAMGEPVLEFGLRRAQGIDGGLSASRAAFIGGCASTSNVLAGKLFGIPVSGTHSHSWIMTFDTELEAFKAYANALPDNCIFLVDTYDSLEGVRNAIEVGRLLRENGKRMAGIRIDSGDLAYISQKARVLLDEAGFSDADIVASNNLDENLVRSLKNQDARITMWGIGTRLATAYDQPAIGGVYKMSAIEDGKGNWEYKIKLSEQTVKINNPGIQQVRRYYESGKIVADMIYDIKYGVSDRNTIFHPGDYTKRKLLDEQVLQSKDLLVPVFQTGKLTYDPPDIREIQAKVKDELNSLYAGIKRFENPHTYPVGLEQKLYDKKMELIFKLRQYENH
ncbi:MAG: nicotinate phosphoribosyltransferase [Cyclobacteriaceae bacterium]|nr:nicotinate phosphoribosyltransferase [Cyclobacteriaceae bacterium]